MGSTPAAPEEAVNMVSVGGHKTILKQVAIVAREADASGTAGSRGQEVDHLRSSTECVFVCVWEEIF